MDDFEQLERSGPPSSQVVSLPQKMYLAMAHCYFGGGPRFRESVDPRATPEVPELPPPDQEVGKLPPLSQQVTISRPSPGVPRGVAIRDFPSSR